MARVAEVPRIPLPGEGNVGSSCPPFLGGGLCRLRVRVGRTLAYRPAMPFIAALFPYIGAFMLVKLLDWSSAHD